MGSFSHFGIFSPWTGLFHQIRDSLDCDICRFFCDSSVFCVFCFVSVDICPRLCAFFSLVDCLLFFLYILERIVESFVFLVVAVVVSFVVVFFVIFLVFRLVVVLLVYLVCLVVVVDRHIEYLNIYQIGRLFWHVLSESDISVGSGSCCVELVVMFDTWIICLSNWCSVF